jgi:hypothetical protein
MALVMSLSLLSVFQYTENQRLTSDDKRLATELNSLEEQRHYLVSNFTYANAEIKVLKEQVVDLEKEIKNLQRKIGNYTPVGLTFLWNPSVSVDTDLLSQAVDRMNERSWNDFKIYFFIYHAGPQKFMPENENCSGGSLSKTQYTSAMFWVNQSSQLYPGPDIPVGIFGAVGNNAGCVIKFARFVQPILIDLRFIQPNVIVYLSQVLTHELLHGVVDITDQEILDEMGLYTDLIPMKWLPRIQESAKLFAMQPPQ